MIEVKADALEGSFEAVEKAGVPAARPMLAGGEPSASGFEMFLRSGGGGVEMKAFTGASDGAGGLAVPRELDAMIDRTLKAISPIRSIANVVQVGSAGYRKLVTSGGATPSGWAAETGARAETDTPVFHEVAPPTGELFANPAASQAMLDDASFDVEEWLSGEIAHEFAAAEGSAFVNGNGTNKPKGFLQAATASTGDAARAFGTLQYVASGSAGAFSANPEEKLIDLVQTLRAPYRQGASWVMNSATLARIRKFKTSAGEFLWAPSLSGGYPNRLAPRGAAAEHRRGRALDAAGNDGVAGSAGRNRRAPGHGPGDADRPDQQHRDRAGSCRDGAERCR
ncbi:phage major capsid protein [Sphingomonas sp. G-3-2-10]|uniref:phage major capsid protein n=1 Tax=Sphingomonas sp. G-3-2-10 TaxID=2728838 RepID=UPI00146E0E12|nr:phage major capsid protein [Sphingomonas sp. G-3-2-10]NML07909.1 phage major capsid protein [Sphingomonas sp. G-3-2-10]